MKSTCTDVPGLENNRPGQLPLNIEIPLDAVWRHVTAVRELDALAQQRRQTLRVTGRRVEAIRVWIAQCDGGSHAIEAGHNIGRGSEAAYSVRYGAASAARGSGIKQSASGANDHFGSQPV